MKSDLAVIRAIEVVIALVIVFVIYSLISAGTLGSIGRFATGWYSQKMDGVFTISVIDTSIKLPQLDKGSLPIAAFPDSTTPTEAPSPAVPPDSANEITTLSTS